MISKLKFFIPFFALFLLVGNVGMAQDIIHKKKEKEPIRAKVVEIGTAEIKYKLFDEKEGDLIYVLEKRAIEKIEFANGRTEFYGQEQIDLDEYFEGQKRQGLKVSFLGPLLGYTNFIFEKNIKPGRSWEAKAVAVGLGFDRNYDTDSRGFIGSFSYKLFRKPSFVTPDMRRRHILQGAYFKPEVFIGNVTFKSVFSGDEREGGAVYGTMLNFGKQWVVSDVVLIDLGVGIGYGKGESLRAYVVGDNFAGSSTLNIGFAF